MKDFDKYIDWMYKRDEKKGKHTLKNIQKLLEAFDNPQDKIKVIHVAGTNGKGSTCNFLSNTLSKTSKVGLFISPFMECMTESITINGVKISEEDFVKYIEMFKPVLEKLDAEGYKNTYFEVLTAIMYKYFYDQNVDVAIVEVGMGGTLDSTNIVKKPIASVIVTISMDHVGILGNTIEEIAMNKAGIIKEGAPVFLYPKDEHLYKLFKDVADSKHAPLYTFTKDEVKVLETSDHENDFDFRNYKNMRTSLVGVHQFYNAALAITVLDYFKEMFNLTEEIIKEGIFTSHNSGRLELISKSPKILVDGSHNKEAMDALVDSIKVFKYNHLILVFSILKDKDYEYAIKELSKITDKFIITTIDNPERAFKLYDLEKEVKKVRDDVVAIADRFEAINYATTIAEADDLILVCGSLYLVRDVIKFVKNK